MLKTLEALDKFARTLPPTPQQQAPGYPGAGIGTSAPVRPEAADAADTGRHSIGAGEDPVRLPPSEAGFRWSELLRSAPRDAVAPAESEDARPFEDSGQSGAAQSSGQNGAATAAAASMGSPAATRSEGTTRHGSRGEWNRVRGLVGLVLLVATVGIGCQFLVRVSAMAGQARGRQQLGKSHSHPRPSASRRHPSTAR